MIEQFVKLIPEDLKEISGSVFYSGRNAFEGGKKLYILGLNPGGSPDEQSDETINWHTNLVLNGKPANWSEYCDEQWQKKHAGTYGLQPRVIHLLKNIGLDPRLTPSSNICFVRSRREKNISNQINQIIEKCWPFHEAVINRLKIKIILCFGSTSGNTVRKKLNAVKLIDEFIENNNRKWKTRVYQNYSGMIVIIAPHPSIADWTNEKTDPSKIVKKYLEQNY